MALADLCNFPHHDYLDSKTSDYLKNACQLENFSNNIQLAQPPYEDVSLHESNKQLHVSKNVCSELKIFKLI